MRRYTIKLSIPDDKMPAFLTLLTRLGEMFVDVRYVGQDEPSPDIPDAERIPHDSCSGSDIFEMAAAARAAGEGQY